MNYSQSIRHALLTMRTTSPLLFLSQLMALFNEISLFLWTYRKCAPCHPNHHCRIGYHNHQYLPNSTSWRLTSNTFAVNQLHVDVSSLISCRFVARDPVFHDIVQNETVACQQRFDKYG
jgi:hypothetical protein